jgi:hypothetical protein
MMVLAAQQIHAKVSNVLLCTLIDLELLHAATGLAQEMSAAVKWMLCASMQTVLLRVALTVVYQS